MNDLTETFGEPIYEYTRQQAIDDGELVDVSEWASADRGFLGGFRCPVAMTRALWAVVDVDSRPPAQRPSCQSTRGRAHDVLFMASLRVRGLLARKQDSGPFDLLLTNGRQKKARLWVAVDGDGVTIGYPEDF